MRRLYLAICFLLLPAAVQAAEITVYSPQIVNGPLRKLAEAWTAETGNTVTFAGFNVGRVRTAVTGDVTPADIMVAPTTGFADYAAKQVPGTAQPLGRIVFGLVVKKGGPKPDISTKAKFIAVAKQAGVIAHADPKNGSLTGKMVEDMLKRPEFSGVEARPIKGMIGDAIGRGDAEFGGGAITEILMAKDAELVAPFPEDLGLHVDMSAAVLKVSTAPKEAEAFLRFVTRPETAKIWKEGGVVETPK